MRISSQLFRALMAISIALLVAPVFACGASPGAKHKRYADTTYGQPRGYLERKVRHELLMLPYFSVFDNLEFRVDGYTVTLMGEVTRPVLKQDAERAVRHIEGVERVVNNIQVLPTSLFDDQIRRATFRAIYGHPAMTKYAIQPVKPIRIIVDNGHVTLVGVVASEMDRNIAYIQANSVRNVFAVTNRLQVEG